MLMKVYNSKTPVCSGLMLFYSFVCCLDSCIASLYNCHLTEWDMQISYYYLFWSSVDIFLSIFLYIYYYCYYYCYCTNIFKSNCIGSADLKLKDTRLCSSISCETTLLLRDSLSLSRSFLLWLQPWSLSTIMLLWHSFLIIIIIIIILIYYVKCLRSDLSFQTLIVLCSCLYTRPCFSFH